MKRTIALLMALTMVLMLASCSAPGNRKADPEPEREAQIKAEQIAEYGKTPAVTAAMFWYDFSDSYYGGIREALGRELEASGIKVANYDAKNDPMTQIGQIDKALSGGAKLLIINSVPMRFEQVKAGMTAEINGRSMCDKIKETGIPVIFINNWDDSELCNDYENVYFFRTGPSAEGSAQGKTMGDYLREQYDEHEAMAESVASLVKGLMSGTDPYEGLPDYCVLSDKFQAITIPSFTVLPQ